MQTRVDAVHHFRIQERPGKQAQKYPDSSRPSPDSVRLLSFAWELVEAEEVKEQAAIGEVKSISEVKTALEDKNRSEPSALQWLRLRAMSQHEGDAKPNMAV